MAFDAFLKLDGVTGESRDDKHKDEIDIQSFQWGLTLPIAFTSGGGGVTGRATFQDFSFTADTSKASPVLFLSSASGKHIKEGIITIRSPGAQGEAQEYYIVKLSDVLVSSYSQAASTSGDRPMDQFSLNYSEIHVTYKPQNADGTLGQPVEANWDLRSIKS